MKIEMNNQLDHELKGSIRRLDLIYDYLRELMRNMNHEYTISPSSLNKEKVIEDMDKCLKETTINWERMKEYFNGS